MNAADVMSSTVIAISQDAPLSQAARLMIDNHISGLPVLDPAGHPVGVLTEGDLLQRGETGTAGKAAGWLATIFTPGRLAGTYVQTHGRRVSDVMTPDPITIDEATALADISELMRSRRVKRLPVTRDGKVVGIVSRADLVHALAKELDTPAATASDTVIRNAILAELASQPWAPAIGSAGIVTVSSWAGKIGNSSVRISKIVLWSVMIEPSSIARSISVLV